MFGQKKFYPTEPQPNSSKSKEAFGFNGQIFIMAILGFLSLWLYSLMETKVLPFWEKKNYGYMSD